jgi:hypothetical protein
LVGVDEDVVVTFVVAPPRAIVVADEHRHLTHEPVGRWDGELGHDRPVVAHASQVGCRPPSFAPFQVAQVDREDAVWAESLRGGGEGTIEGVRVGQVVQGVTDGDDRVCGRNRIVGKGEEADVLGAWGVPAG